MESAPIESAEVGRPLTAVSAPEAVLPAEVVRALWQAAEGERVGVSEAAFAEVLRRVGERYNYGLAPGMPGASGASGASASLEQRIAFCGGLQLRDLALAQGCAAGSEAAWERFVGEYQGRLRQAAVGVTGSVSMGEELAGSLYGELYGLTERDGVRRSPLAGYAGRGSLMGWLRTTLAQRHVDHHRRTRREEPLEEREFAAETPVQGVEEGSLPKLGAALTGVLQGLEAEERFLLASYYLDGRTLLELARLLRVHEATVSRRLKRLTEALHKQLVKRLEAGGMSRRAAQEALGNDPRDLTIDMRNLLQSPPGSTFFDRRDGKRAREGSEAG